MSWRCTARTRRCVTGWTPGNAANHARGEHLVARAAIAVGLPDVSLRHARRCLELVEGHPDEMEDWDAPFAHEALARALAATGDTEGGARIGRGASS